MSENQQPLTEEQAEPVQSVPAEVETVLEENEASALTAETDDSEAIQAADDDTEAQPEETEEEEEDIDPADVKIFGMPRVVFHYTAFGVAIGYILSGVLEMAHFNPPNATILAIAFAVVGYIIGSRLYKKRKAERDRAKADAENNAE
ncbi:hypothetical protein [Agathobaculum sp. Marseille-P7918]|uniref:hypothetical protein n=1 Tax=Agathobaculum sp. Marseille-P7918 TaxID=2479843 RepID=UPI000F63D9D1|nr:hypothetical protein [Agathobaculum sp. Marseille-P7918]